MAASKKSKYRALLSFLVYLILLGYFLFFAESMGRNTSEVEYRYNLVLFQEIKRFFYHSDILGIKVVMMNIVGNVVAFMPFGYFVPRLAKRKVGFFATTLFSLEFSLFVEAVQLVTKTGSFDVDDLLLNTLGGILGYIVYCIVHKRRQQKKTK